MFFILFLIVVFSTQVIAQKIVAVVTFDIVSNVVSKEDAETITELYIAELLASGKVIVASRTKFNKTLKKIIKLGNAINADIITRGKIMKLGGKFLICVSLIEVKTAKVLSNVNQSIKGLDEAPNGLITLTQDILKTIALTEMEIGKTGPGGGIIFYIDGDKAFECSKMLEEQEWENAKEVCKQYRGGGYAD